MSLRRRVALSCAAAVAVAVILGSAVGYFVVRDVLRGQVDDSLRLIAARLAALPPAAEDRLQAAPPLQGPPVATQFVLPDGAIEPGEGERILFTRRINDEAQAVGSGHREPFFADREVNGQHVRVYTARGPDGLALQAVRSLEEVDATLSDLRLGLGLVAVAGIVLAALLARLATTAAVRPVAELTGTAEHVARTRDLSRRIEATGDDELGRLARSFNTMLEALESSRRAQRRLVADASHELRTPLTSLRTNLEVLGDDALAGADRERLRADVVAQLEEFTELVGDLVDLARDDEPRPGCAEPVALDELVAHAVERAGRHAPGVVYTTDLEPAVVSGVPGRIDRAVANLLDNAAKWSPPGASVEVRLRGDELTVRDHGPGIATEDLPHVFDRFYRAASARGRAGSGLGLAIVRQVAEAHGGTVAAEAAPGGGALLRLRLSPNS
jgi:two-component system sensor histidine kinase MprB